MKKDRSLSKLYDRLTPQERFELVIRAKTREDEEDVERLAESCPRKAYNLKDLAFGDRVSGSLKMTMMLCQLLAPSLANLRTLSALRDVLSCAFDHCVGEARLAYLRGHEMGVRRAWEATGKEGDPPSYWKEDAREVDQTMEAELRDLRTIADRLGQEIAGFLLAQLEEVERHAAGEALTVWQAFANVCHEQLRLEPEKLVQAWFEPVLPEIEKLKNLPDPPGLDPEEVERCESGFRRACGELAGRD